jgi:hypothetical protein
VSGLCRAALVALAVSAAALGSSAKAADPDAAAEGAPPLQIYAVPALADALRELAVAGACPRTALPELVLAAAATLVQQIERGARADVLAIDDAAAIEALVAAGHLRSPLQFEAGVGPGAVLYWVAPLRSAPRPLAAADFVDRVLSRSGQALLGRDELRSASE